jgi:hypothetical protein
MSLESFENIDMSNDFSFSSWIYELKVMIKKLGVKIFKLYSPQGEKG